MLISRASSWKQAVRRAANEARWHIFRDTILVTWLIKLVFVAVFISAQSNPSTEPSLWLQVQRRK